MRFLAALFIPLSLLAQNAADSVAIRKLLADSAAGPAAGSPVPTFKLKDQHGRDRDRASLSGSNGLVLIFFRSADW